MSVLSDLGSSGVGQTWRPSHVESASLRVLHVLEATLGGTRRYLEDIASTTSELPILHGLVYGTSRADSSFSKLLEAARVAGWFLAPVDAMRRSIHVLDDAQSVARVRRAIQEFKPSILHLHSAKGGGIGRVATLARGMRLPRVVYSPHALPARLGKVYMAAEHFLAPFTDRFIAVSESERREIVEKGIAERGRIDVVYPCIDAGHYAPTGKQAARQALRLPQNVPIVIGIGRLTMQKDPVSFVSIIARLRTVMPTVVGLWVGDGDLRSDVEAEAKRLRLGKAFEIVNWVPDVRSYIAASDVLLSTSHYESFGYVVAEALAMERPVVATRVTGTIDIFHSAAEALLFSPGDTVGAVKALEQALTLQAFREDVTRLARLSVIDRFSKSAMAGALIDSYRVALA